MELMAAYCRVTDEGDWTNHSPIICEFDLFEEVSRYLRARYETFADEIAERKANDARSDLNSRDFLCFGYCVTLISRWNENLIVGISKDYWFLMIQSPPPTRIIRGELRGEEIAVFFLPGWHWTEFQRADLVPRGNAVEIVKNWLDMGEIPANDSPID
jgi:hypothetical protein